MTGEASADGRGEKRRHGGVWSEKRPGARPKGKVPGSEKRKKEIPLEGRAFFWKGKGRRAENVLDKIRGSKKRLLLSKWRGGEAIDLFNRGT